MVDFKPEETIIKLLPQDNLEITTKPDANLSKNTTLGLNPSANTIPSSEQLLSKVGFFRDKPETVTQTLSLQQEKLQSEMQNL